MFGIPPSPDQTNDIALSFDALPPPPEAFASEMSGAVFAVEPCIEGCGGLVVMKYEADGPRKVTHFPAEYMPEDAMIALQGMAIGYVEGARDETSDRIPPSFGIQFGGLPVEPHRDEL